MDYSAVTGMILLGVFALYLLYRDGLLSSPASLLLCMGLTVLALGARLLVFDYETLDYQNFLSHWVDFFRTRGGFSALRFEVGNYNIPYLYFLALFSYLDIPDLYLIKLLSVFFDLILAWACMLLLGRFKPGKPGRIAVFFAVLCLPTVFLNGALWGQCDSSYVACGILGLYLALDDKPVRAMVCAALSFGFKLQAVFLLPVFAVLWMAGKVKWKHFLLFPFTYFLLVLPAVLLGRPLLDTLLLYFNQTGSIGSGLNYNSPSAFSFFQYRLPEQSHALASSMGIVAAFLFLLIVLLLCFIYRKRLTEQSIVLAALLFAIGIPFLLPHMHERYFFAADVLSLVVAFLSPVCIATALCTQFASLLGYHAYLKMRYLLLMDRGAWALLFALCLITLAFFQSLHRSPQGGDRRPDSLQQDTERS